MDNYIFDILVIVFTSFLAASCFVLIALIIVHTCRRFHPDSSFSSLSDLESLENDVESTTTEEEEAPHGLDESVIYVILSFIYTTNRSEQEEESHGECVVCLEEYQDNDHIRTLPFCSHTFHLNCIDVWLRSNPRCPLCRSCLYFFEEDFMLKALMHLVPSRVCLQREWLSSTSLPPHPHRSIRGRTPVSQRKWALLNPRCSIKPAGAVIQRRCCARATEIMLLFFFY